MMEWFLVENGMASHRKIGRLSRRLGCGRMEAIGIVTSLMCWCARYREDGHLGDLDPEEVAEACRWSTDPVETWTALRSTGWIDEGELGPELHDWLKIQHKYHRAKVLHAKRQAEYRARRDAAVTPDRHASDAEPSPVCYLGVRQDRTGQDRTKDISSKTPADPPAEPVEDSAEVRAVFEHYLRVMDLKESQYRLTNKRRVKIRARLKEFDLDALCAAIDACRQSKFHMGKDPKTGGKLFNDLADHILRSEEKVEYWIRGGVHATS